MSGSNYYYPYGPGGNTSHQTDPPGNSANGDYASHTGAHPSQHGMYYDESAVNGWPTPQDAMMQQQQQQQQQGQPLQHAYLPLNGGTGANPNGYDPNVAAVAATYDYPNMYYHHDAQTGMVTVPTNAAGNPESQAQMAQHGYGNGDCGSYAQHQPHPSAGMDWNTAPAPTGGAGHASTGGAASAVEPFDVFGDFSKTPTAVDASMAGNGGASAAATAPAAVDDSWIYQLADIVPPNQTAEAQGPAQTHAHSSTSSSKSKSSRSSSSPTRQPKKRRRGPAASRRVAEKAPSPLPLYSNNQVPTNNLPETLSLNSVDPILADFSISISSLSQEPLSGMDIVTRVEKKALEVQTRYLPCVEFLVLCQQELRQGLTSAMQAPKTSRGFYFYQKYLQHLPSSFSQKNQYLMSAEHLTTASSQLTSLLHDTEKGCYSGNVESMKNSFLGGMRDGESWGLRKWLSKNGGALQICNDLELILGALRQLTKGEETTIKLAERCCPKAKEAFVKLKQEVPDAYQEVSSAHPYLPFFHRLESALKGLMTFDPNKDDVICLDDSDDEEEEQSVSKGGEKKSSSTSPDFFQTLINAANSFDNDDSDIEIVCVKDKDGREKGIHSEATSLQVKSDPGADEPIGRSSGNGSISFGDNDSFSLDAAAAASIFGSTYNGTANDKLSAAEVLVDRVDNFASLFESGMDNRPERFISLTTFWSTADKYADALRILRKMIVHPTATLFLDPVDSTSFFQHNLKEYYALIKNPICFRDIVNAITVDASGDGKLKPTHLKKWSMYEGGHLIEATDLVFLNGLAFIGKTNAKKRKEIQKLRNSFWEEVRTQALFQKKNIPTKRAENSGFVIHK